MIMEKLSYYYSGLRENYFYEWGAGPEITENIYLIYQLSQLVAIHRLHLHS